MSSSKIEQSKLHSSKNTSKIEEKQILDKTEKNQTVEQNINNLQVINVQKKERKESKTMIDTNTLNQERTGRSPLVKQKTHMTEKYSIRFKKIKKTSCFFKY